MIYSIYNKNTGEIRSVLTCSEDQLSIQFDSTTEDVVEGSLDCLAYVENGILVPAPESPGIHHSFDFKSKQWVDARTLEQCKNHAIKSIKSSREKAEFAGFVWNGFAFDSDAISQSRIQGAVQLALLAPQGWSIDWTLKDNSTVTLSHSDMIAVGLALGTFVSELHAKARQLKDQILAAQTKEELDAIVW